jgi:hypothetical protein
MPGHRSDWDTTRLTDVWLSRDGSSCFARSLLCEGFVTTSKGEWHAVDTAAVTAVAPWGADGFLLGLHDGRAVVLDGDLRVTPPQRLAKISGRFLRLVTHGTRAFGLVGHTVVSAEVGVPYTDGRRVARGAWSVPMELLLTFDQVGEIDVDAWSQSPAIAVLGDDAIMILDALTGDTRSRYSVTQARQAKWIGAGLLLVLDVIESRSETRTRIRVLDVLAQRWTEPVVTSEVSRIAVRGDEIHVGYANQTIAVWDRRDVCRGIGAWSFRTEVPDGRGSDRSAPVISDVVVEKTTAS